MRRFFAVLTAAAVFAVAVSSIARAETSGPKIADYTLANGLELVVIPDHRAPVVTNMIWYKVGAADEQPGKSGLAHFLEHLMFKGTAKHPAGEFSDVVARMGGQENAFTTNDYTAYFQRVPSDQLKTVMAFEADRMTGLVLTDAVVLPERQVILEERNQRIENAPRAQLGVQMDAALYLNSPYHKPVIGWRHEMEHLSRDDAIAFYKRFYGPNNAVAVIAGDVTPEHALSSRRKPTARSSAAPTCRRAIGRPSRRRWPRARSRSPTRASNCRPCGAIIWCRPSPPASAVNRKRSISSRISSAPAPTACSIRTWWSTRSSRSPPVLGTTVPLSPCPNSRSTARRVPA